MDWVFFDDVGSCSHDDEESEQVEQSNNYEVLVPDQRPFINFAYTVNDFSQVDDTEHDDEYFDSDKTVV